MLPLIIGAGAAIGGSIMGAQGARKQIDQMKQAIAYQKQKDAENKANYTPYVNFGQDRLNKFGEWLDSDASNPSSFLDPGFQFRQDQGMKTLTGNAATAGMLKSGDTLRAATEFGQDAASQEYANAFGRRMDEGNFQRGNAGIGLEAAGQLGSLANQGSATAGQLTANTDFGGPDKIWGNAISGVGGMAANSFARGFGGSVAPATTAGPTFGAGPRAYKWGS